MCACVRVCVLQDYFPNNEVCVSVRVFLSGVMMITKIVGGIVVHFRSLFQSYMNERNTAQKEQFEPVYVVSIKMSNVGVCVCVCVVGGWGGGEIVPKGRGSSSSAVCRSTQLPRGVWVRAPHPPK